MIERSALNLSFPTGFQAAFPRFPHPSGPLSRPFFTQVRKWLAYLVLDANSCAAQGVAPGRSWQSGQAWQGLLTFGPPVPANGQDESSDPQDHKVTHLLSSLFHLARDNDPLSGILLRAFTPLAIEQNTEDNNPFQAVPDRSSRPAEAISFMLRTLRRWCDWIDADIHLQTHASWNGLLPGQTPAKRALAHLSFAPSHFITADDLLPIAWACVRDEVPAELGRQIESVLASKSAKVKKPANTGQPEVDCLVISLWPLVKRHDWTCRDLLAVVRLLSSAPEAYPCGSERDLFEHCGSVLGLRSIAAGGRFHSRLPRGHHIALALFSGRA